MITGHTYEEHASLHLPGSSPCHLSRMTVCFYSSDRLFHSFKSPLKSEELVYSVNNMWHTLGLISDQVSSTLLLTACPLSVGLLPTGNAQCTRRLSTRNHNHHLCINLYVGKDKCLYLHFSGDENQTFTRLFDVCLYRNYSIQRTKKLIFVEPVSFPVLHAM